MSEIPDRAAALIFDENGVWLVTPKAADAGGNRDVPPYVRAVQELAARLSRPCDIERLAAAFETRRRGCR